MLRQFSQALLIPYLLSAGLPVLADEEPDWEALEAEYSVRDVSEGELVFLTQRPAGRILHTTNILTITPESLDSGWVGLEQCQSNLDPIDVVEVVYRYHGIRDLRVVSFQAMDEARVEGSSIQMRGVRQGGEVCISAGVRVLHADGQGGYFLQSGPFHRRFLDGYYPLELDYRIHWPAGLLALERVTPAAQAGMQIDRKPGALAIDTLFEGRLLIGIEFSAP